MSDNPGIGKQVASSVVCTTHDCFILSSLPRSCLCDTYCTKLHLLGICESWCEASRAEESALGQSMSWVMSGRACWNQFAYLRHIREKVMFDPRAWSWLIWKPIDATEVGIYCGPTEYIRGLFYKLRMRMGAKVDEPTNVFADNKSVLCNARAMASTLKKKQYALAYHFVQGGVARD